MLSRAERRRWRAPPSRRRASDSDELSAEREPSAELPSDEAAMPRQPLDAERHARAPSDAMS